MRIDELEQSSEPLNLAVLVHQEGGSAGLTKLKDGSGLWASKSWDMDKNKYQRLVGGIFSVHSSQNQPSHFGGEIVRIIPDTDPKNPTRGIVIFKPSVEIKNGSIDAKQFNWGSGSEKSYY